MTRSTALSDSSVIAVRGALLHHLPAAKVLNTLAAV